MNIIINYWAVIGAAIFLFVAGAIWYGPLFGKTWMKIMGSEHMSPEERKKAMEGMMPRYILTFILSLVTSYVLYTIVKMSGMGVQIAFWIWLGFTMPMAAGSMWDSRSSSLAWKKFLIIAGYQLIALLVLGWAFTMW